MHPLITRLLGRKSVPAARRDREDDAAVGEGVIAVLRIVERFLPDAWGLTVARVEAGVEVSAAMPDRTIVETLHLPDPAAVFVELWCRMASAAGLDVAERRAHQRGSFVIADTDTLISTVPGDRDRIVLVRDRTRRG